MKLPLTTGTTNAEVVHDFRLQQHETQSPADTVFIDIFVPNTNKYGGIDNTGVKGITRSTSISIPTRPMEDGFVVADEIREDPDEFSVIAILYGDRQSKEVQLREWMVSATPLDILTPFGKVGGPPILDEDNVVIKPEISYIITNIDSSVGHSETSFETKLAFKSIRKVQVEVIEVPTVTTDDGDISVTAPSATEAGVFVISLRDDEIEFMTDWMLQLILIIHIVWFATMWMLVAIGDFFKDLKFFARGLFEKQPVPEHGERGRDEILRHLHELADSLDTWAVHIEPGQHVHFRKDDFLANVLVETITILGGYQSYNVSLEIKEPVEYSTTFQLDKAGEGETKRIKNNMWHPPCNIASKFHDAVPQSERDNPPYSAWIFWAVRDEHKEGAVTFRFWKPDWEKDPYKTR